MIPGAKRKNSDDMHWKGAGDQPRRPSIVSVMDGTGRLWFERHSGSAHRLKILRGEFNSRLKPIAFNIYTRWLLTRRAQAHIAVSLNLLNF